MYATPDYGITYSSLAVSTQYTIVTDIQPIIQPPYDSKRRAIGCSRTEYQHYYYYYYYYYYRCPVMD